MHLSGSPVGDFTKCQGIVFFIYENLLFVWERCPCKPLEASVR